MTTLPAVVRIVDLPVGTTITGVELLEVVQTASGVGLSVQVSLSQAIASIGGLPAGGTVGQVLTKSGTTNYAASFTSVISTSLGVLGTTLVTGSFGVVGTSQFTGVFNVVGTATFTGMFGVNDGTSTFTSAVNIIGTTFITGILSQVGTALFTANLFGVVGTSIHTGAFILGSQGAGVLTSSATGVVSAQGGMVLLNTLSPNAVASTNDTTSLSSTYRNYLVTFENVQPAVNTATLAMQIATSGANWTTGPYSSKVIAEAGLPMTSSTAFLLSGNSVTTSVGTSTNIGYSGSLMFFNPAINNGNTKMISGLASWINPQGSQMILGQMGGYVSPTGSIVTGVNFLFSSGNIATGTIKIYGMT